MTTPNKTTGGARVLFLGAPLATLEAALRDGLRDPRLTDRLELAERFAEEACAGGEDVPVVLRVEVDASRLRYAADAMADPVPSDGRTEAQTERLVGRVLARAARRHPGWTRGGVLEVPASAYALSLGAAGVCRHEGTIPPGRVSIEYVCDEPIDAPPARPRASTREPRWVM